MGALGKIAGLAALVAAGIYAYGHSDLYSKLEINPNSSWDKIIAATSFDGISVICGYTKVMGVARPGPSEGFYLTLPDRTEVRCTYPDDERIVSVIEQFMSSLSPLIVAGTLANPSSSYDFGINLFVDGIDVQHVQGFSSSGFPRIQRMYWASSSSPTSVVEEFRRR